MKINLLALSVTVCLGSGFTALPHAALAASPALPNCFDSNFDRALGLFTLKNAAKNQVNQQCLLTVGPRGGASSSRLAAGRYQVSLSNGGGGGAGGTLQGNRPGSGGGGGGGGAGALEQQATLDLSEGVYRLTIGAGGPGGSACMLSDPRFGGGPGWLGSPSNIVRLATSEVVMGKPGAETFKAPTRAQNERSSGKADGRGGSGPGQTTGGRGGSETVTGVEVDATRGASTLASGRQGIAGAAGTDTDDKSRSGGGGGGGATRAGAGGSGGGETTTTIVTAGGKLATSQPVKIEPIKGALGSGGGGGQGSSVSCEAGAAGGHGFIRFQPI